jgi:hypothetical protein
MENEEKTGSWGNCCKCGTYGPLNEEKVCRTCILYPKPNTGEKQAEWRLSKLKKKEDKDDE